MARKLAFVLALIGLCLATAVYALGLGNIQSDSSLNEPLSARVPLLGVDEDEASSVSVKLASAEVFERAGVERPFSLSRLNFEVKQGPDGAFIEVTTKEPVKEPFLDFLVEVRWPQGRLVREYTLLLDPPTYAPGDQAPATQAPAVASESTPAQPESAAPEEPGTTSTTTGGATASGATELGQVSEVSEVSEPSVGQYTVKANDTLWEVAQNLRPSERVTINQTMLALFRENPDAFINSDMNRLKRGAVLRVPESGEIGDIPVADANAEVQRQIARWQRNRGVAGGSGSSTGGGAQETAAAQEQTGGELRVVAPESGTGEEPASSAQGEGGEELQRQVTLLKESNASLESENEDLKAQVEALKREVAQLESEVNVEAGQALPGGEQQGEPAPEQAPQTEEMAAGEAPEADEAAAGDADAKAETEEATGEQAAAQADDQASEDAAADTAAAAGQTEESAAPESEAAGEASEQAAETEPQPEPEPQAEAQPEPRTEPEARPQPTVTPTPIWQDPMIMGLAGAVVLVLLLLVYMVMRRRGGGDDEAVQDLSDEIAKGLEEDVDEASGATGLRADDSGGDETFAGFDEEPPELPPESDPAGEAEVYLAYGRYDQAQDVLERGLQRDPDNKELRLKMLEVLALTQDRGAFEDQAQQLHSLVDDNDPAWQRALEMGREIAPEHPLFAAAGAAATTGGDDDDFGFDLSGAGETPAAGGGSGAEEPDKAAASGDDFSDFDFSFEDSEAPSEGETSGTAAEDSGDFDLDFALDEDEPQSEAPTERGGAEEEPAAGLEDLQFDLDEASPENPASAPESESDQRAGGNDDLSLDFDLDEDQPMASPTRDEGELTESVPEEGAGSDGLEDFSFDFEDEGEQESAGAGDDFEATTKDVDMQSTALDYNVEEPADTQSAGGAGDDVDMLDEVGTKLDLARAYLDMGDNEGARALLDEVVEEGNDAQIKEAQELLAQAG